MNKLAKVLCLSVCSVLLAAGCQNSPAVPANAPTGSANAPSAAANAPAGRDITVVSRTFNDQGAVVARLSNGMTVIVKENHNVPVVCVESVVHTGGMYEGKWLGCGLSHLCEHLVAQGAEHEGATPNEDKNRPANKIDQIGGQSNASTSMELTNYYIEATSSKTNDCIDLIADWMARPTISEADFNREHGVVQRELEMGQDEPDRVMWYAHAANAYGNHPAAVPVIGYPAPLAAVTHADVIAYHQQKYVPQNMVFAVVGDVQVDAVLNRVCQSMKGFASGRMPELKLPDVDPIAATRRVVLHNRSVTEGMEHLSFQTIPLVHEDLYALDLLSFVLSQGESSRLEQTVRRRDQLVTSLDTSSFTPEWGKGMFLVEYRTAPDKMDAAEKAILAQLADVVAKGVTAEELDRAKRQKVAELVYAQQTVHHQASTLAGDFMSTGNVGFSKEYVQRIQTVTAEQVQAAAKKYFDFDRMVVTRMLPGAGPTATTGPAASTAPTARAGQVKTESFTLPNGLRVVLSSSPNADLVSMVLMTKGGLQLETPENNGMGTLMTALSPKGAGEMSAEQIAQFFDTAGGSIGAQCGNNSFLWQATILSENFSKALPIFSDVVQKPTYPAKELGILRTMLKARIRQSEEGWFGRLNQAFRREFFKGSPLALLSLGTPAVLEAATPETITAYHNQYLKGGSTVLSIYGKFDLAATRQQVEKLFATLPAGENTLPQFAARTVKPEGENFTVAGNQEGAGVMIGVPSTTILDQQDNIPLTVLDTIISGYQLPRGWLHDQLRGQKLVYFVHAYNFPSLAPGAFMAYAQCEPPNAEKVAAILRENFKRTTTYAFTQAEVDEAVNIILTADLLGNQSTSSLAQQAAGDEMFGFGYDYRTTKYEKLLRGVAPADVSRVAKKFFSNGVATAIVLPAGKKPATGGAQ